VKERGPVTLLFDRHRAIKSPTLVPERHDVEQPRTGQIELVIGLVNNMPDGALKATERQFARLLQDAAPPHVRIRFPCFSLPSIIRAQAAQTHVAQHYSNLSVLKRGAVDGLIVTGAEPIADDLHDEPYWPELTSIVDWAATNTRSTIWSCLAAHAAVLHLDGIARRKLDAKCSGVYDCHNVADDWLTMDIRSPLQVSHSRYNVLEESELVARGYQVLTRSDTVGVDIFARPAPSRFIFFQGHPEYDALSLQREYMRDIARFLAAQRADYPNLPAAYFDSETEQVLKDFEIRARASRDPTLAAELPGLTLRPGLAAGTAAKLLFRNWLNFLADGAGDKSR
jgi:homoserine O-succinyltransferase/O-acetyltransferase